MAEVQAHRTDAQNRADCGAVQARLAPVILSFCKSVVKLADQEGVEKETEEEGQGSIHR